MRAQLLQALGNLTGKDLPGLVRAPGNLPTALSLSATEPVARPVAERVNDQRIVDAFKHEMGRQRKIIDGTGVDQPMPKLDKAHYNKPSDKIEAIVDILKGDGSKYASNYQKGLTGPDGVEVMVDNISINPNADEAFLFHELGHIANRQSGLGKTVRDARDTLAENPNLRNALMAAGVLAPAAVTGLTPGDDDTTAALLAGAAINAPILADELFATNTGLRMMETAGTRASLGQRGKLAGALLAYLSAPIAGAAVGGVVGNQFD